MPSTVRDVVSKVYSAGRLSGTVRWGEPVRETGSGLYVVSLSSDPDSLEGRLPRAPLDLEAIDRWLEACPDLRLEGATPTRQQVAQRLEQFWLPDEVVLYIGRTSRSLRTRLKEYYNTSLGASAPHRGGYFLKTLDCLNSLHVHTVECDGTVALEHMLMLNFTRGLSSEARLRLPDPMDQLPFANLRWPDGTNKAHGLSGTDLPKGSTTHESGQPTLHSEMVRILEPMRSEWVSTKVIAGAVNEAGNYKKKDGSPVQPSQIALRAKKYPSLFDHSKGLVRLVG